MISPDLDPSLSSSESGELALRESQYRIAFDNLIPDRTNEAGKSEKTRGIEWTSDDGLEMAYVVYSASYEREDDSGAVHTIRGDRLLYYKKIDPLTEGVDDFTIKEYQGGLLVTEFRDMPSAAESDRIEQDYLKYREDNSDEDTHFYPVAEYIVQECLVKNDVPADQDDLERAMGLMEKMKNSGVMMPGEDETEENSA